MKEREEAKGKLGAIKEEVVCFGFQDSHFFPCLLKRVNREAKRKSQFMVQNIHIFYLGWDSGGRHWLCCMYITPVVHMLLRLLTWSFITLAFQSTDPVLAIQGQYYERHCVLVQRTLSSTWILLLDWLAGGMYTLVLCAEMEVGKSAIYALLSRCRICRDFHTLEAEKNCESWDPSQKNRNSSPAWWFNGMGYYWEPIIGNHCAKTFLKKMSGWPRDTRLY